MATTMTTTHHDNDKFNSTGLSPKQKLQLEIIMIDEYLEQLGDKYPESRPTIDHLRDVLGRIMHLTEGVDVRELCEGPFTGGMN